MRKSAPLFCALLLSLSARRAWIEKPMANSWYMRRPVALRKESVDRKLMTAGDVTAPSAVALRKESVDRKVKTPPTQGKSHWSLSARRAWIEKFWRCTKKWMLTSLSARRAWIEKKLLLSSPKIHPVALRKESVDRKWPVLLGQKLDIFGRSP